MEVIPGILEKEWNEIERKITLIRPFAKTIHIDILDGKFAPNATFLDPAPFKKYSQDFFLELHMMVEEPIQYLKPWAEAGFKRFLGHIEKMSDQTEFVAQGQLLGEVGLALDGPSSVEGIEVPLNNLDCLLIMIITAGFSGQKFNPLHLEKVKHFRSQTSIPIEVDGGVNNQTIVLAKQCGATRFISTSFLFKNENPNIPYNQLLGLIKNH